MSKPRVAIFDFACCEGCQLQIVNLEEDILGLISVIEPVEWREAMSEQSDEYDIAIIEGSITRPEDEERLKEIRATAKVLVAMGACATMGGLNKLKNNFEIDDVKTCVYKDDASQPHLASSPTKSVPECVGVDLCIPGCPIDRDEFMSVVKAVALGKTPAIPSYPVCVECKKAGIPCRFEFDEICLGPVTRAGCGAKCPAGGVACFGCRGYVDDPNVNAARDVMDQYGKTVEDLQGKLLLFNSKQEPTHA